MMSGYDFLILEWIWPKRLCALIFDDLMGFPCLDCTEIVFFPWPV